MSELRTDFKDEILQEGEQHRIYNIKRKGTDEVVESEVYLEKAYTPQQEGDEFGAKDVNEINGRLNGLAPQSLLINNDFQVNQRGQSEYPPSEVKYALDMWIKRGSTIKVVTNGIIFDTVGNESNGALGQKVESIEVGKKYTVCINIVSIKGTGSMSIGTRAEFDNVAHSNNLKQGINKITFTATGKWLTVCCKDVEINIEYIDLFEGDIAYPHAKEDYETALDRCQSKIVRYKGIGLTIAMCSINAKQYIGKITLAKPMKERPTIFWNGDIRLIIDGKDWSSIERLYMLAHDSNTLTVSGEITSDFTNYRGDCARLYLSDETQDVTISCEPL